MYRMLPVPPAFLLIALAITACSDRAPQAPTSADWHRVDAAGHTLAAGAAEPHRCVLDAGTGLMWQVHATDGGLHDSGNRYTWFSDERQVNMGEPGQAGGGQCAGSACDTQALVEAVNRSGHCGHDGWRLPDRQELLSIGDERLRGTGLIVDPKYFPGTVADEYWTSETFRLYPQSAWAVNFGNGLDRADLKTEAKSVRLVRQHRQPNKAE